jgi:uridine kinase
MLHMPAGLDGHPDPIVSADREAVLALVSQRIAAVDKPRLLFGVDGAPGAGKSTFADEIAKRLSQLGLEIIRSTTDSFHRPRAERYRLGPTSPQGYYLDSHDLAAITDRLLHPFAEGARRVQVAAFDEETDMTSPMFADVTTGTAVLVFDGLFLLRPELAEHWQLTVHLQAERRREDGWRSYLHDDLPEHEPGRQEEIERRLSRARWPRYSEGWQLYVDQVDPLKAATIVIDNDELATPIIR